jgi:Ca2+-binding RTX toxin-like protein
VREKSMVRRAVLLLTTIGVGVLLASGVALAANPITCLGGLCEGTTGDDEMTGTSGTDYLYAKEGNDTLRGLGAFDDLRGGPGNDDLDGGGGNDRFYAQDGEADEIICGPGGDVVVTADPSLDSISIPDCIDFIGP